MKSNIIEIFGIIYLFLHPINVLFLLQISKFEIKKKKKERGRNYADFIQDLDKYSMVYCSRGLTEVGMVTFLEALRFLLGGSICMSSHISSDYNKDGVLFGLILI